MRRRRDVIKQPEFARIEIARQGKAKTVILQSNRRLVQKRDLASHAQSLFRIGDHIRRQSHTPKKRRHWYAGALEARDSQAGKPPPAIGIESKSCSEFRAEEVLLLILEPSAGTNIAAWQQRTNVWLRVTSPARGAKRPRGGKFNGSAVQFRARPS